MLQFSLVETLGLYIQVPFCQTNCTYCNFHTGVVSSERFTPYIDAVCHEIARHSELSALAGVSWPMRFDWQSLRHFAHGPLRADTVYIGGGTPSLLDVSLMATVPHAPEAGWTCEGTCLACQARLRLRPAILAW